MDVRVGPEKKLYTEGLICSNCGSEKILESTLDYKEIKWVKIKLNQHWIVFGRADTEAEVPKLLPPDAKSKLIGKYCDAGID